MLKQLQNKVDILQKQNKTLQLQSQKKSKVYEDKIQELEKENNKLKKIIENNAITSPSNHLHSTHNRDVKKKTSLKGTPRANNNNNIDSVMTKAVRSSEEMLKQNEQLKKEIADLTHTYQLQLEQISLYFSRIKKGYLDKLAVFQASDSSIKSTNPDLMKLYDKMLKDFGQQRKKYIQKIEQLANYIQSYQEKDAKNEEQIKSLTLELEITRQELRIFKRCR